MRIATRSLNPGRAIVRSGSGRVVLAVDLIDGVFRREIGTWTSGDGVSWSQVEPGPRLPDRSVTLVDLAAYRGGFAMAGNITSSLPTPGAVTSRAAFWTSSDGSSWSAAPDDPSFGNVRLTSLVATSRGLVAAGMAAGTDPASACSSARAWRSLDGHSWEAISTPELGCAASFSVVAFDSGLAAAAPSDDALLLWSSEDGSAWREMATIPTRDPARLVASAAGLLAFRTAEVSGASPAPPQAWFSADGRSFTPVAAEVFGSDAGRVGGLNVMTAGGEFVVSAYGAAEDGAARTDVWTSRNGLDWQKLPPSPALDLAPPITAIAELGEMLVAIGGSGYDLAAWVAPASPSGPAAPIADARMRRLAIQGPGFGRDVAATRGGAIAVGFATDPVSKKTTGRIFGLDETGWTPLTTTGLEGAEPAAVAEGPGGLIAVGVVRATRESGPGPIGTSVAPAVWLSGDGRGWTETLVGPAVTDPDFRFGSLVDVAAGGPGFVAVGSSNAGAGVSCSDVPLIATSADGEVWQVVRDPDLGCGKVAAIAVVDGGLVAVGSVTTYVQAQPAGTPAPCDMAVCGGGSGRPITRPVAWVSANGRDWSAAQGLDELGWGQAGFEALEAVPGGLLAARPYRGLSFSARGDAWTTVPLPLGGGSGQIVADIAFGDGVYLAVGTVLILGPRGQAGAMWLSSDGQTWSRVSGLETEIGRGIWAVSRVEFIPGTGFVCVGFDGRDAVSWIVEPGA